MRKIAIVNFKGGTGKTTTVVNVGAGLAMRGKKVLLVDVDSQGSLAISLGTQYETSLADVLAGRVALSQAIIRARPGLDLVPSDYQLLQAQRALARFTNWQETLSQALAGLDSHYDFIILDCAASLTPLNINALTYADEICIPTQIEYLSLMGLAQVLENLARVRFPQQPRHSVFDLGISLIIPTMYDVRKRQSRRLLQELRASYGQHVANPIRTNVRLSEAPACQKTIFEYDPRSPGAFDYNRLVDTMLQDTLLAGAAPIGLTSPFRPMADTASPAAELVDLTPTPDAEPTLDAEPDVLAPLGFTPISMQCPYCHEALVPFVAAGYRTYQCERCGYQKQVLMRDLQAR